MMPIFPACKTGWMVMSFTEIQTKLGGEKDNLVSLRLNEFELSEVSMRLHGVKISPKGFWVLDIEGRYSRQRFILVLIWNLNN